MHCCESELWLELCTRGALVLLHVVSIYEGHSMVPLLKVLVENPLAVGWVDYLVKNLKASGSSKEKLLVGLTE